ncbi:MAG TPA: hemolysin family protein [Nakamurella sp.]
MNALAWDILVVLVFILIGGVFNAAEVSMISLRQSQVEHLAATKGRNGQRLEKLVSNPTQFLAAVQIGVTVATMLSSAFGAATVSENFAGYLLELGVRPTVAQPVALVGVTLVISFCSLVLGELTPKRLGLQRSETIALAAAGPVSVLARLFTPIVWLLGRSSDLFVRLFGGDPHARGEMMGQDELRSLVLAHESLTSVERRMIVDVFAAETTRVREVMVPRPDVEFLPATMSLSRAARIALAHPHSRYPVIGRDSDEIVGVVHLRDLLAPSHPLGRAACVGDVSHLVTVMPGTKVVLDALQEMRSTGEHLAVVVDEYGGTDGIVTLEDLVEEIVGEVVEQGERELAGIPARKGRHEEVDGRLNLDDFAEMTGIVLPPGPYDTAAGYLMAGLGRLPSPGDSVVCEDRVLTVTEMDGRRIARIEIRPVGG